jgi:two-component system chemotaxis sensor kinase CheA
LVPLVDLNEALRLPDSGASRGNVRNIAILEGEGTTFGLILDHIQATREIVVKPLGRQLKRLSWYAGATILGDGSVALILDVAGLARRERIAARGEVAETGRIQEETSAEKQQFLLFACGSYGRVSVPLAMVDRLEKFPSQQLERMADCWVVQYRGALLRIVALAAVLGSGGEECLSGKSVNVIVFRRGERALGLAVDRILDVQQGVVTAPSPTSATGLLATFVLNGAATELMDLPKVLEAADPVWRQPAWIDAGGGAPVLVGANSRFAGTSMRQYLELGGYPATVRETGPELGKALESGGYRALVLEWPVSQDDAWLESLRARCAAAEIPAVAVVEAGAGELPDWIAGTCPPNDCQALLRAMEEAQPAEGQSEGPGGVR